MHEIVLNGYTAQHSSNRCLHLGTAESYGIEQLHITPGPGWDGLLIKATFHPAAGSPVNVLVGESGVINVPPAATAVSAGEYYPGVIVFSGTADGVQRISANLAYTVTAHASVDGNDSKPTPSQWEQMAAAYQSKVDKQQGAENAGKVLGIGKDGVVTPVEQKGGTGIGNNGATFFPSVSDDGVISWTNDGEQPNPDPVNIKGPAGETGAPGEKGADGYTPVKGVDYFDGVDGVNGKDGRDGEDGYTPVKGVDYFDGKDGKDYVLTDDDKNEIAKQAARLVEIPTATETTLGGVKAIAKTEGMTQQVGIDENGMLWVVPTGSSSGGDTGEDSGSDTVTETLITPTFVYGNIDGKTGEGSSAMSRQRTAEFIDCTTESLRIEIPVTSDFYANIDTIQTISLAMYAYDADGAYISGVGDDGKVLSTPATFGGWLSLDLGTNIVLPSGYKYYVVHANEGMFANNASALQWLNTGELKFYLVSGDANSTPTDSTPTDSSTESVSMLSFDRSYTDTGKYTENLLPKWDGMFSIHRGYSTAPNNTLQAIWEAKKHGYNCCELDVRYTSDDEIVLSHDAMVTGTVDGIEVTYTIADTDLATLKTVCVGNTAFPDAHVCSLEDAMKLCRRIGMRPEIDFKVNNTQIYSDCLALAMKYGLQDDTLFCCYGIGYGVQIKTAYKKANIRVSGELLDNNTDLDAFMEYGGNIYAFYSAASCGKNDGSNVGADTANETRIPANKARGYKMYVWNVTPNLLPDVMQWEPDILQPQSSRDGTDWYSAIRELNSFEGLVF